MATSDDPILSIQDLEVTYTEKTSLIAETIPKRLFDTLGIDRNRKETKAVDGVSLDIAENDVVAVVGESGSGKTTLGKTAVVLQEPTAGNVVYDGHDVWEVKREQHEGDVIFEDIRQALQIVHQDPGASLNPYRTIKSSLMQPLVRWYPDMTLADRRTRILGLFEECGLTPPEEYEDRYPHELSGGEKQRVALIRAMLMEPDVIFADEPVSALDPSLRVEIMDLMLELQEMFDTSFIFVSHNLEHARYIAKKSGGRIAIMYLGEIVEIGPADEVIRNPSHPYTQSLKASTLPVKPDAAREAVREELELRTLDGPDAGNTPDGCHFHVQCPHAREACQSNDPELVDLSGSEEHISACFREVEDHEYWNSEPLGEVESDSVIGVDAGTNAD